MRRVIDNEALKELPPRSRRETLSRRNTDRGLTDRGHTDRGHTDRAHTDRGENTLPPPHLQNQGRFNNTNTSGADYGRTGKNLVRESSELFPESEKIIFEDELKKHPEIPLLRKNQAPLKIICTTPKLIGQIFARFINIHSLIWSDLVFHNSFSSF